jgi:predicted transcriptional regulator YheO
VGGVCSGQIENMLCRNVSHARFKAAGCFVQRFSKQPQDQDSDNHAAQSNTEQEECRQQFAYPVK